MSYIKQEPSYQPLLARSLSDMERGQRVEDDYVSPRGDERGFMTNEVRWRLI